MAIRDKKILITAGPTWVPIDKVRVISNIATGETGILLARQLQRRGGKVTLFLGPVNLCRIPKKIRLIRFKFFDELKNKIIQELRSHRYDVIIHNAAVSDFAPLPYRDKIASKKEFSLRLRPLPKIITYIRRLAPQAKLIMFKLESGISQNVLIKRAKQAKDKANADLIIANILNPYRALIVNRENKVILVRSKNELINRLTKLI
ncbi:MAG: phosphopantothenoylcysteine decarboxylase [Candidatus Omnitrophica bacterium]|nr:phosphopantothenoylcysteine decarboxylase [Candidatus Omnitrophota bacterium]